MNLTINNIGIYLPENRFKLEDIHMEPRLSDEKIKIYKRFYGLNRVAISDISLEDMMFNAGKDALTQNNIDPDKIKLLIHAHTSPETHTWSNNFLNRLCRRLGLKKTDILAIHINNCASTLNGLLLSQNYLVEFGGECYVLLLTADLTFSGILQQIPNTTLCGDAATACIISLNNKGAVMQSLEIDYFGKHAKGTWQSSDEISQFEIEYSKRLAGVIQRSRYLAGIEWDQIRWIFPHNVNLISWRNTTTKLQIPMSKIYLETLPELGHCFGADIFINWYFANHTLQTDEYVMVATVGLGAVFGAAVFKIIQ